MTTIPTIGAEAPIGAAAYLAVIAYPNDHEKRTAFVNACKAWLFIQIGKGRMPKQVTKPTILRFSKTRIINAEFTRVAKLLGQDRTIALQMCKMLMLNQVPQVDPKDGKPTTWEEWRKLAKPIPVRMKDGSPFTITRWLQTIYPSRTRTLDDDGKFIYEKSKFRAKNFHKRGWKESKPVLHLVWALDNYSQNRTRTPSIEDLIWDASWVDGAVKEAESMRLNLFPNIQSLLKKDEIWLDTDRMIQILPE